MSALLQQMPEWHEMFLEFPELENLDPEILLNMLWRLVKHERKSATFWEKLSNRGK